ncbi:MAG: ribose 5-phosphate isomerase B [Bacteroidales bacterium]|nr:ribose 5-phosphate isomerase B [Bacteroidales bacterium]
MFNKNKVLPIACDHGGYDLKEYVKIELLKENYLVEDMGTFSPESVDYPDYIHPLAEAINKGKFCMGIIICGSGNGVSMTANKYPEVRAALCWNAEIAKMARLHNDANILALPGRYIDFKEALRAVNIFFTTDFEKGRHTRRVNKIAVSKNNR